MRYVDDASNTLTEAVWPGSVSQRSAEPAALARSESRVGRFFTSLAASMALHQRKRWNPYRDNHSVFPSEILAQHYPHLYIQVMCG